MAMTQLKIGEYVDLDVKYVGRVEGVVVDHRISGNTIVHTIMDVREPSADRMDIILSDGDEIISRTPLAGILFDK